MVGGLAGRRNGPRWLAISGEDNQLAERPRAAASVAEVGSRPLSLGGVERLQRIVIGDQRFVRFGLRDEGASSACTTETHACLWELPRQERATLLGVFSPVAAGERRPAA